MSNVVRMDFWMVESDIRMARKVGMVVIVSKNLDFAEWSVRENHQNLNRNCGKTKQIAFVLNIPKRCSFFMEL